MEGLICQPRVRLGFEMRVKTTCLARNSFVPVRSASAPFPRIFRLTISRSNRRSFSTASSHTRVTASCDRLGLTLHGGARMKYLWVTAFVILGNSLIAKAQSSDTRQELIALEQNFNAALLSADWRAVERIYADDLVFTNADGSVTNKSDEVGAVKSGDIKFESIEMSDVKVQDLGDVAVLTGKLVERVRYKTTDLGGTYRFTDVWAKRNGLWQIVAGHESRVDDKITSQTTDNIRVRFHPRCEYLASA